MNSSHQIWSRWTATIATDRAWPALSYLQVRDNCARFYRKAFGAATELRLTLAHGRWTIDCRTEGHPAHNPAYRTWMTAQLRRFFRHGFGAAAEVQLAVRLEAGDRQDGTPPDQLILGPPTLVLDTRLFQQREG